MIVTIDGPAGAGKSTVARTLARRLGFKFLDTGAMYRAVALAGLRRAIDWQRPELLARLAREIDLRVADERILLDGADVTDEVRSLPVTAVTRYAAGNSEVREQLVEVQRTIGAAQNIVTEGRDQGTVVFPTAACKIFLTATPEERARRRLADLHAQGETITFDEVLASQERRDREDSTREVGPLVAAADAIEFYTDGCTQEQVVDQLEAIVRRAAERGLEIVEKQSIFPGRKMVPGCGNIHRRRYNTDKPSTG